MYYPPRLRLLGPLCRSMLVMLLLAGCAAVQAKAPSDPVERLRGRVEQYWDARMKGDQLETYQLHEPVFRRAVSLTAFLQNRGVYTTLEYQVVGQEIKDKLATVRMRTKSSLMHPKMIRPTEPSWSEFEEQWVNVEGEWYRKFRFPIGDPYPPVDWSRIAPERQVPTRPAQP